MSDDVTVITEADLERLRSQRIERLHAAFKAVRGIPIEAAEPILDALADYSQFLSIHLAAPGGPREVP